MEESRRQLSFWSVVTLVFLITVLSLVLVEPIAVVNAQPRKTETRVNSILIRFLQDQITDCATDVNTAKEAVAGAIEAIEKKDEATAKSEMMKADEVLANLQNKIQEFLPNKENE